MVQADFLVNVICYTYNHASYIEDAMNGFCMQQTSFKYVCTIIDDCSTDGEPDVIKRYLTDKFDLSTDSEYRFEETDDYLMIYAQNKTNKNCYFAVYLLKYNHFQLKKTKRVYAQKWSDAKYSASCEGDDYWIDSLKLQKQVDFLESHPNHSSCIHAYKKDVYFGDTVKSEMIYKYPTDVETIPDEDVVFNKTMFCATSSWVYRSNVEKNYPDWARRAPVGDKPLKLVLLTKGSIGYINEIMSVYRVGVPGSWTNRVLRNRKSEKKLRKGIIKMMKEFDLWSERKYHKYVRCYITYYNYSSLKTNYIIRPYLFIKKLLSSK